MHIKAEGKKGLLQEAQIYFQLPRKSVCYKTWKIAQAKRSVQSLSWQHVPETCAVSPSAPQPAPIRPVPGADRGSRPGR